MTLLRFAFSLGPLVALAACVGEGDAAPTAASAAAGQSAAQSQSIDSQPRMATYRCGESGILTVENARTSVTLTDPQGDVVTLPAAPAAQQTRYGLTGYALVLEGGDALYMKGGKEPLNCTR